MRKIPTLFLRDPEDLAHVTDEVHPACQWVFEGEGIATRKYDGTCVMLDDAGVWWGRREVKPGKLPPHGWYGVDADETTGKAVGWEPIEQTPFYKAWREAVRSVVAIPGTYELCGPKVNGNPEGYGQHVLVRHMMAETLTGDEPGDLLTPEGLRTLVTWLHQERGWEGIVWHHPDGRMAKLKARDYR